VTSYSFVAGFTMSDCKEHEDVDDDYDLLQRVVNGDREPNGPIARRETTIR
jgi:hypothetical protein